MRLKYMAKAVFAALNNLTAYLFLWFCFASATVQAEGFLARVTCDGREATIIVVDQMQIANDGVHFSGAQIKTIQSEFPTLAISGHQTLDEFVYYTIGIRQSGQIQWIWSPEQQADLKAARSAFDQAVDKSGLATRLGVNTGLMNLPEGEKFNNLEKDKDRAIDSLRSTFTETLQKFETSHTCADIGFTLDRGDKFELVCSTMNFSPAKVRDVISKELGTSASLAKNSALGKLKNQFNANVALGHYSACDGFQSAQ